MSELSEEFIDTGEGKLRSFFEGKRAEVLELSSEKSCAPYGGGGRIKFNVVLI